MRPLQSPVNDTTIWSVINVIEQIISLIYCYSLLRLSFCVKNNITMVINTEWQHIMVKCFITLVHVGKIKLCGNLPYNLNPG